MNRFRLILLVLLAASSLPAGTLFYKAAPYRSYLQSFDPSAGLRSSQPLCITLTKGTTYPVTADLKQFLPKNNEFNELKGVIRIRKGIEGPVVSALEYPAGTRWSLPWLPAGFYLLEIQGINDGKQIVTERELIFHVVEDTLEEHERKITQSNPDVFHTNFNDGTLFLKGVPANTKGLRISLEAKDLYGKTAIRKELSLTGNSLSFPELQPGQLFKLRVSLLKDSREIARTWQTIWRKGVYPAKKPDWRTYPKPEAPLPDVIVHENQVMMGRFDSNLRGLDALVKGMRERGSHVININFKWNHLEPLTGVFQFAELDRYVDFFTKRKIPFGLIIGGSLFDGSPYDCWGEWMMDHNGDCQVWRNFCVTSPASPKYRTAVRGLITALYERYKDNPCFRSWTYSGQGLDSGTYMDHYDRITDYSPCFQTRFRTFLKKRYGTIHALNRKWNTDFPDFEKITPPMPDFSKEVDLSRPWQDFTDAKLELFADANTNLFDPVIRALDPGRAISNYLTYMGPIEYLLPAMKKRRSTLNDGGGESHQMVRLYSIAANYGIRRQPESHYVPADKRRQLQDLVTNTLRYGMEYSNLGTVWNSMVNIHADAYPKNKNLQDSMHFWKTVIPVLQSMSKTRPDAPPIGFLLSWDDLFFRTRAWRWYAMPCNDLQKAAGELSLGNVPWLSGISPYALFRQQKVLVVSGENRVFSRELLNKLKQFAREGGTVAFIGNAGKYTVDSNTPFLWRQELNAPALPGNTISQWKSGSGTILYLPLKDKEQLTANHLKMILGTAGIQRKVETDQPGIQGFLLKDQQYRYLVVSAFNGFDNLRNLKSGTSLPVTIRLHLESPVPRTWKITRLYPASAPITLSTEELRGNGIRTILAPSDLEIYRLESKQ